MQPFLEESDPWLSLPLTKTTLSEICGVELLDYLASREAIVAQRYQEVSAAANGYNVRTKFIDQAPLIEGSGTTPLRMSWQVGIDNSLIDQHVDIFEPLIYRNNAQEVAAVAAHYRNELTSELTAILRPTFPDNLSEQSLTEKVAALRAVGISDIDFYLLDAMRPRDVEWIKRAITS